MSLLAVLITVVKSVHYSSHVPRRWGEEDMNYALSFLSTLPPPFLGSASTERFFWQTEKIQVQAKPDRSLFNETNNTVILVQTTTRFFLEFR